MQFDLQYENPKLPLVVTIVAEQNDVIIHFINFYMKRNFNILLVLDQTSSVNEYSIDHSNERIKIINFTKELFMTFEKGNLTNVNRQRVVYNNIMTQTNCEIAFICDADELCDVKAEVILEFFAKNININSVQVTPWEVFYNRERLAHSHEIFSGNYCRRPYSGMERIFLILPTFLAFGLNCVYLNRGLVSHANGKQFVRITKCGRFSYGVHTTFDNDLNKKITKSWKAVTGEVEPMLYHFDAISEQIWIKKWKRKCENINVFNRMRGKRSRFAHSVYKADRSKQTKIFETFYCLPTWFIWFGLILNFVREVKSIR